MSSRSDHDPGRDGDERLPEDAAAALAESITPVAPAPERSAWLRARIVARARAQGAASPPSETLVFARTGEGEWRDVLPGVRMRVLHVDAERNVQSSLLRLAPGAGLPTHAHNRDEECIVLEGDLRVGEHAFGPGDWHLVRAGVDHVPIRTDRGALLFLRGEIF
jgi:anti-sigma factor ChrR (cupin superfamily)